MHLMEHKNQFALAFSKFASKVHDVRDFDKTLRKIKRSISNNNNFKYADLCIQY